MKFKQSEKINFIEEEEEDNKQKGHIVYHYKTLYDSIIDGIYIHDLEGNLISANKAALDMVGYSLEEITNLNLTELLDKEQLSTAFRGISELIKTGGQRELEEFNLKKKDGTIIWVEVKASLIKRDGKPFAIQGIARDITKRKKSEQLMKLQHDLSLSLCAISDIDKSLEQILNAVISIDEIKSGAIYFLDKDTEKLILGGNKGFSKEFINYINSLTFSSFQSELINPEKKIPIDYKIAYLNKEKVPADNDIKGYGMLPVLHNGDSMTILIVAFHIHEKLSDQTIAALEVIASQAVIVKDRITTQEALINSEKKYRELFEKMGSGFCLNELVFNEQGAPVDFRILEMNPTMESITGFKSNLIGKDFFKADAAFEKEWFSEFVEVTLNRQSKNFIRYSRQLNKWLAFTVYSPESKLFALIINDITERRAAETAKITAMVEMEQIFNTSSVGMWIVSSDYSIVKANRRLFKIFNLDIDPEELRSKKCYEVLNIPACGTAECPVKKISAGEKYCEFEIDKYTKNIKVSCVLSAIPFYIFDLKTVGILGSFTDITRIRELENEIISIRENERSRIGKDLHDGLGQHLTGIAFMLHGLENKMSEKFIPEITDVRKIYSHIEETIDEVKNLSKGLCPVPMTGDGLITAIEEMLYNAGQIFNIKCIFEKTENILIKDNNISSQFYFIANEAVNNAIKHAKPDYLLIQIKSNSSKIQMSIENDCKDVIRKNNKGLGLKIMKSRAALIGADFRYELKDGKFIVILSKNNYDG